MSELEVGMFVKYTRGAINGYVPLRIARIVDCSDNELIKIDNGQVILRSDVVKARHKIIDLIEVGDYVNGVEVEEINDKWIMLVDNHLWIDKEVANKLIESVVTTEQFENMKYEVKKDE